MDNHKLNNENEEEDEEEDEGEEEDEDEGDFHLEDYLLSEIEEDIDINIDIEFNKALNSTSKIFKDIIQSYIDDNQSIIDLLSEIDEKDTIIIEGINKLFLYKDISIIGSSPINILFLCDNHSIDNLYLNHANSNIHLIIDYFLKIKKFIKLIINKYNLNNYQIEIKSIELYKKFIKFFNEEFYNLITKDLFTKDTIIRIDLLLYYISKNVTSCYDIFIEDNIFKSIFKNIDSNPAFLNIVNDIFFYCGNKIIYQDEIIHQYSSKLTDIECDFNIRLHRSDIRLYFNFDYLNKIYYNESSILLNLIPDENMEIIIDQLLDYIFNIDNETFYYEFLNVFNDNIIL